MRARALFRRSPVADDPPAGSQPGRAADDRTLVAVRDLESGYPVRGGLLVEREVSRVQAVAGVSLDIRRGETLGLVGESGCGKSTLGRTLLMLHEPSAGSVCFEGRELTTMPPGELRRMRLRMQMVFQDPFSSLNPRMTVGEIVGEPLRVHKLGKPKDVRARVRELLALVGLSPEHINRYPHQFSGGQRQRIGIARALAVNPKLLVCDEAVSALDVSIQAQILNLMADLKQELDLTYLFVSHDLSVVRHVADRVAVMYLGKIVELGPAAEVFARPVHPYTRALLSAVPQPDPALERSRERVVLAGDVPNPASPPPGCRFHTRCPIAEPACRTVEQELGEVRAGHTVACHVNRPARTTAA